MPRMLTLLVVCLLASLFTQDPPTASKPLYSPTGQEATLVGSITVDGETERPWQIDMSADPVCTNLSPRLTEFVVRNGDKLQNVFVYFKSGDALTQYAFTQPTTPAVLKHKNCFYRPRMLGIRVNQPIEIENDDPTTHNTHPTPKLNREWNQSQMPGGAPLVKTFAQPEVPIPFKCNQHPWEKAYVGVFNHPFFAISDMFGHYEIRGIPPGSYKLVVWHEKLGEQETEITLVPGEVRNLDFTFPGNAK